MAPRLPGGKAAAWGQGGALGKTATTLRLTRRGRSSTAALNAIRSQPRRRPGSVAPPPPGVPRYNFLDLLLQQHEDQLKKEASSGIDYRQTLSRRAFPFSQLVKKYALLLGRKGGLSAFTPDELDALRKIFNRYPRLDEPLLVEAFEKAQEKTLPYLAYELNVLARTRRNPRTGKEPKT